ncbi:MAG: hypothetical protein D3910_16220 [Candidatus Electrothrix sp. ATG2]|nr:hypothetical protein [Candidatus Electrothrix sp. ATG2]
MHDNAAIEIWQVGETTLGVFSLIGSSCTKHKFAEHEGGALMILTSNEHNIPLDDFVYVKLPRGKSRNEQNLLRIIDKKAEQSVWIWHQYNFIQLAVWSQDCPIFLNALSRTIPYK